LLCDFRAVVVAQCLGRPLKTPFLPVPPPAEDLTYSLVRVSRQLTELEKRQVCSVLQQFGQFDRQLTHNFVTLFTMALDGEALAPTASSGAKTSIRRLTTADVQNVAKALQDSSSRRIRVPETETGEHQTTAGDQGITDSVEL